MRRPYDCVKRAWHSERHQPIRGTLIQEIFRVVNEIHACSTKKNKQYQEKLPVVVLKAEEILYSKANSEEEYMDLTTLLERTNEAIDAIIRRHEFTGTGEYLRPCIEAALSLGCSLTKASRGQSNNQKCYLSRITEEVPNVSHDTVHNANRKDHTPKSQYVHENVPSSSKKQCLEHEPPSNLSSVYPFYCGINIQLHKSQDGFEVSHDSDSLTCGPSSLMSGAHNLLVHDLNPSSERSQSFISNAHFKNPSTNQCDLSLRLGPFNVQAPGFENVMFQDENLELQEGFRGSASNSAITKYKF